MLSKGKNIRVSIQLKKIMFEVVNSGNAEGLKNLLGIRLIDFFSYFPDCSWKGNCTIPFSYCNDREGM